MDELTIDDVMAFAGEQVDIESENADHDMPNHAETILNSRVADLLHTVENIEMAASEGNIDGTDDERALEALQADVVDIILAVGAFVSERDLDITTALNDRIEEIDSLREFESRLDECETDEEIVDALEETMGEDMKDHPMVQQMESGVETGDNVDMENYDGDQRGVY